MYIIYIYIVIVYILLLYIYIYIYIYVPFKKPLSNFPAELGSLPVTPPETLRYLPASRVYRGTEMGAELGVQNMCTEMVAEFAE